jgi:hypothetical protein
MKIKLFFYFSLFQTIYLFSQKINLEYFIFDTTVQRTEETQMIKMYEGFKDFSNIDFTFHFYNKVDFGDTTWKVKKQSFTLKRKKIVCDYNLGQIVQNELALNQRLNDTYKYIFICTKNTEQKLDFDYNKEIHILNLKSDLQIIEKLKEINAYKIKKDINIIVVQENSILTQPQIKILNNSLSLSENSIYNILNFTSTTPIEHLNISSGLEMSNDKKIRITKNAGEFETINYEDFLGCVSNTDTVKVVRRKECVCSEDIGKINIDYKNTENVDIMNLSPKDPSVVVPYDFRITPQTPGDYEYKFILNYECLDSVQICINVVNDGKQLDFNKCFVNKNIIKQSDGVYQSRFNLASPKIWGSDKDKIIEYVSDAKIYFVVTFLPYLDGAICRKSKCSYNIKFSRCE